MSVEGELSAYKILCTPNAIAALKYWCEQSNDYPILSTVARHVYAISVSSAQSERDLSSVGRTVCKYVLVYVLACIAVTYLHSLVAMTTMTKEVNNGR